MPRWASNVISNILKRNIYSLNEWGGEYLEILKGAVPIHKQVHALRENSYLIYYWQNIKSLHVSYFSTCIGATSSRAKADEPNSTGVTGYIGGDVLSQLILQYPTFTYRVLVRTEEKGKQIQAYYPQVQIVYGRSKRLCHSTAGERQCRYHHL